LDLAAPANRPDLRRTGTANTGFGPQPLLSPWKFSPGESLRDYWPKSHHLNTRERLEIAVKVCEAIIMRTSCGLIHRESKSPGKSLS
jgi:hypothetical protein